MGCAFSLLVGLRILDVAVLPRREWHNGLLRMKPHKEHQNDSAADRPDYWW
jgi:hypothetical protein